MCGGNSGAVVIHRQHEPEGSSRLHTMLALRAWTPKGKRRTRQETSRVQCCESAEHTSRLGVQCGWRQGRGRALQRLQTALVETSALYTKNLPCSPKYLRRVKNKQSIMASNSQKTPTTKSNKRKALTLENYYKNNILSRETGEDNKQATMPKTAPPPQMKSAHKLCWSSNLRS